jgi:hypothetical protein
MNSLKRFDANQLRLAVLAQANLEQVLTGRQTMQHLPVITPQAQTSTSQTVQPFRSGSLLLFPLQLAVKVLPTAKASFDQLGCTSVQRFAGQVTVMPQSLQHFLTQDDLQKTFRFLLQSGAPSTLRLTKLVSAFFALLGGELRHWVLIILSFVKAKSSAFD